MTDRKQFDYIETSVTSIRCNNRLCVNNLISDIKFNSCICNLKNITLDTDGKCINFIFNKKEGDA